MLLLLLLGSFLLLRHPPFTAADVFVNDLQTFSCTGGTYALNSTYGKNLNTLLSSLTSLTSTNATAVTGTDRAYGLYLCEGDLAPTDCQTCVEAATTSITRVCAGSRRAVVWYDYCIVRYSDDDFFGVPDTTGSILVNQLTTSSPVPFQMVSNMVREAPLREPLMFASNASTATGMYAMAQCTADLASAQCSQCLNMILDSIGSCCTQYNGWRYLARSCWIRYEARPFLRDLNGTYTELVESNCSSDSFPSNANANLKLLFSGVTAKARTIGFYNGTTTLTGHSQLYGLALCRADLSVPSDECSNCLISAGSSSTTKCSNKKWGTIWYEKCLLRYSNANFFGVVDGGGRSYCGAEKVSSAVDKTTVDLATSLVAVAAKSALMFVANKTAVGGGSQTSYVLLQCTRDLSSRECETCLRKGMSVVTRDCSQTKGWKYLSGSCIIRYETYAFFNTSAIGLGELPVPQPATPTGKTGGKQNSSISKVAIIVATVLGLILLGLLLYFLWWILKRKNGRKVRLDEFIHLSNSDLSFMALAIILEATGDFSDTNKLGEGGYGPVYKGILHKGQEIAVKRLSTKSKQGASEFKNEIKLIAKLQHRNLVRILGCCVEKEEKLLIYEYLPNRSLDIFLFDSNKRSQLNWTRRRGIIAGISRGILYLHEDSLLRIIHRDLKPSNVLLDNDMNPKISDFGMAKIFEMDESASKTGRVVGTPGYMAPEYALDGIFSVKSDVYSFGVMLLEILSGEKNGQSHFEQHGLTLLRRAWELWHGDRAIEMMDPLLGDSYPPNEAIKLIHIGLLCVQENADERPTMSSVVLMERNEQIVLSHPTQPPTFFRNRTLESNSTSTRMTTSSTQRHSINEVTITDVDPR